MSAVITKSVTNPLQLQGLAFVEFASPSPKQLDHMFREFGFSRTMRHKSKAISYYNQHDIHFLLNEEPASYAADFCRTHGPSIAAMGWKFADAQWAYAEALRRGAEPCLTQDYLGADGKPIPAIVGIGGSALYFLDEADCRRGYGQFGFVPAADAAHVPDKGFLTIDHLTNNVPQGTMQLWANFYKDIFGFYEVRYFDIRGIKTGLTSFALRSPCGSFCIPINEGTEDKSQINEYLREYNGAGVQHLAFLTQDIIHSLRQLQGSPIEMLDMDDEYYASVFQRVPNVVEDHQALRELNILVDGDADGYLLQIFTKNLIGPIFIEIIQRKNHDAFGEGNFGALFRSIERDQERRGAL